MDHTWQYWWSWHVVPLGQDLGLDRHQAYAPFTEPSPWFLGCFYRERVGPHPGSVFRACLLVLKKPDMGLVIGIWAEFTFSYKAPLGCYQWGWLSKNTYCVCTSKEKQKLGNREYKHEKAFAEDYATACWFWFLGHIWGDSWGLLQIHWWEGFLGV